MLVKSCKRFLFLCNAQKKILFNVVLMLLGQDCTRKKPYAMLSQRLQTTLYRKNSRQCRLSNIQSLRLYQVIHVSKKYEDILPLLWKSINQLDKAETSPTLNSSSAFYPATGQTSSRTLSKQVKLLVSHSMLLKPMQSCLAVSVKCRDQDCISR